MLVLEMTKEQIKYYSLEQTNHREAANIVFIEKYIKLHLARKKDKTKSR